MGDARGSRRAQDLARQFEDLNSEMIAFVENCSDEEWAKTCSDEGWAVGVVMHHVAQGHYAALGLVKMAVAGESLPQFRFDAIHSSNAQHAREYADCTRDEVLGLLRDNGAKISAFIGSLNDADLDRTGTLGELGDINVQQILELIIIGSSGHHLASAKAAVSA